MFFSWMNCAPHLFLLDCPKRFIRNNGLMGVKIEIPIHKAIIFHFSATYADGFLEKYTARILLVG